MDQQPNDTPGQQVTIIATLYAKAGQEAALAARMHEMIDATRKEAGCILYELQRSDEDPREFIMVEYWRDAEAIALHDASAHMAALVADLPALVDRPVVVRRYTPA
ncbi:quinol monooxygenase YgiN [Massilia sp. UYP11]|uniref:putative quinol monooxygenase n=1 Tax=Massilia sp. UYP11 TaxID=1756385 RepID=UPI003D1E26CE